MRISDWSSDVCSSDLHARAPRPLQSLDRGDAHLADEIGVFAERLLDPAPARIARDIDHRGQRLRHAARADFACGDHIGAPHQIGIPRSEEHTSELQSLMRISYAVLCLKKKTKKKKHYRLLKLHYSTETYHTTERQK